MVQTPSTNPYQPPEPVSAARPLRTNFPARRTLQMLRAQRGVVWSLVVKFCIELISVSGALAVVPRNQQMATAFLLIAAGTSISLTYFAFRGAKTIFGTAIATIYALMALVPCIGVLVAFALSLDLRDVLRQTGAEVGLTGATADQLREWESKARLEMTTDALDWPS